MTVELAKNKAHLIVKRDGREEPYTEAKMWKVVLWACDGKEALAQKLMDSLSIKINNRMRIQTLYRELINTAVGNISDLQPYWDKVAANLYLMELYKETYSLKKTGQYPDYLEVVQAGLKAKVYGKRIFGTFTDEELTELGNYIKPDNDLLFTYKGLHIFFNKYCMKKGRSQKLELPQHAYMRAAIFDFHNDRTPDRIQRIKEQYDYLSSHDVTLGTPHIVNGGSRSSQIASCVLSTVDDDTFSINDTDANMAVYSKFSGGLAVDVSRVRAKGAEVKGNRGVSGGVIPFIKKFERTVSAWNQGGTRSGSCVVTFPFWHLEIMDILPLKDAGGTEDTRARKLQYAMTIPDLLEKRFMQNEEVTLFCPSDVPDLFDCHGDVFEENYIKYENKHGIRKKTVPARDLIFTYLKYRQQTGNEYGTYIDNINNQNMSGRHVGSSNLCTEITIPSYSSVLKTQELLRKETGDYEIVTVKKSGEIGLCNLASVNLLHYWRKTPEDRYKLCLTLMTAMDNAIETQFYPVKEAMMSNMRYRPVGIGVLNYASLLAANKMKITDEAALQFTHEVFEDLYFNIYSASVQLAKERGRYDGFAGSLWEKGETPVSVSILAKQRSKLNFPLRRDWDALGQEIKKYGVRFSYHGAIAPTATSGKSINATESTEPVHNLFYVDEGTSSLPTLANNLQAHREYYVNAYDVPATRIIELAAIRQKFIDQAQSINEYHRKPESAYKLALLMFYSMKLGIKSAYYLKTPKDVQDTELCASCT